MMISILSLRFFCIHLDGMDNIIKSFHIQFGQALLQFIQVCQFDTEIVLIHFRFADADCMEQPELPNGELDNGSFFGAFSQKTLNISLFIRGVIIFRGKFSFPRSKDFNA